MAASVECTPTYTVKGAIECRFQLKNNGKQTYSVLKWSTPLEEVISDCLTVTRDGKKLEYDGIYRKRSNPGPDQFLTVGAGQTLSSTFQVSDAFDMTKAGVYSIAVDTYLRYVVGSASSKPDIKRKIRHVYLSSPGVIFQIVGRSSSKGTLGQKARFFESKKQTKLNGIINGTFGGEISRKDVLPPRFYRPCILSLFSPQSEFQITQHATEQAQNNAYKSITSFLADPQTKITNVNTWFGVNQLNKVVTKLQTMKDVLEKETITYSFCGLFCRKSTYAYCYRNSRKIYLCKSYKKAPDTGLDSKMGILTHELSHAILSTRDLEYFFNPCKFLAFKAPHEAINNANNFEYFVETL